MLFVAFDRLGEAVCKPVLQLSLGSAKTDAAA